MFYNQNIQNEIIDLKNPTELFELLTTLNSKGEKPFWSDIWEGIKFYKNNNQNLSSVMKYQYFLAETQIKELEDLGLNINYKDNGEDNFFSYACQIISKRGYSNENVNPVFMINALKYVESKTIDIISPNKYGQNILFEMLSFSTAGLEGKEFFNLIKRYPKLNIHAVNTNCRNLLFDALMNPAPLKITEYLVKNNVSLKQVDKDGYNLLHMFLTYEVSKESISIFNKIFQSIDNIASKTKYGENFLETFILCIADDKDKNKRYESWINLSLNNIVNRKFNQSKDSIDSLLSSLESYNDKYLSSAVTNESKELYLEANYSLKALSLAFELPTKIEKKKKANIKI